MFVKTSHFKLFFYLHFFSFSAERDCIYVANEVIENFSIICHDLTHKYSLSALQTFNSSFYKITLFAPFSFS